MKVILTVDNTGSMGQSTNSAQTSVEEIRTMCILFLGRPSVKMSVYGDYDGCTPDNHCGGWSVLEETADSAARQAWLQKYMRPMGGAGEPEAQKTAFNHLLRDEEERSIIFHFTDDPPHLPQNMDTEGRKEEKYLSANQMEGDWFSLCELVKEKHRVVTFLTRNDAGLIKIYGRMGEVVVVPQNTSTVITSTMMAVLLRLIGQPSNDTSISYSSWDEKKSAVKTSNDINVEITIKMEKIMEEADPPAVIGAFDELLDPNKPDQAICLTTNAILGKFWRLICGKYRLVDDGKYADQSQQVMDKLSNCKTRMNAANQQIMKKWIDESHDDTPIIRKMVADALPSCTSVLVLSGDPQISLDDLLALGRGGGSYKELSKLLATLEEVPVGDNILPKDPSQAPEFIPLQRMGLVSVFRQIANLIKPGIMFSRSTALLAAILALPNKHLTDMAKQLLAEQKGTWIDFPPDESGKPKFPTNFAINFIRILNLLPNQYLTNEEVEFRDKYLKVEKVLRNHHALVTVVTGLIQKEPRMGVTWKRLCQPKNDGCGQQRCFTIFPAQSRVCGICLAYKDPEHKYGPKERGVAASEVLEAEPDKTNWTQCFACKANYGVTAINDLNVRPKCYYCRFGKPCPTVECHLCHHKYISEDGAAQNAMQNAAEKTDEQIAQGQRLKEAGQCNAFVCPRCVYEPSSMIQQSEVKLVDLVEENNKLKSLVPIEEYDVLVNTSVKLWKRVLAVRAKKEVTEWDPSTPLKYKGYSVHDPFQVAANFKQKLLSAKAIAACPMCVEDTPLHLMTEACGDCPNRICQACVQGWYGRVEAGCVVSQSNTLCPFCKSPPKHAVIKNLAQAHMRNIRPSRKGNRVVCEWDPQMWHAACARCLLVKPAVGRACAGEAPPLRNFMCDECQEAAQQQTLANAASATDLTMRPCPGCGIKIEKRGGCNHITCTQCNEHWCWGCGKGGFDGHSVYDHMSGCNGIFPDGADEDEE